MVMNIDLENQQKDRLMKIGVSESILDGNQEIRCIEELDYRKTFDYFDRRDLQDYEKIFSGFRFVVYFDNRKKVDIILINFYVLGNHGKFQINDDTWAMTRREIGRRIKKIIAQ